MTIKISQKEPIRQTSICRLAKKRTGNSIIALNRVCKRGQQQVLNLRILPKTEA